MPVFTMTYKPAYARRKQRLLADAAICEANRALFARFLEYEEYKLKRMNGLATLDDNSLKTLLDYTSRLRTVNEWFENKPWVELTKDDIKCVYDAVEDGQIRSARGQPYKAMETYYRRIMRSKPFALAGKRELAREVMEFRLRRPKEDVRFIREHTFRRLVDVAIQRRHKLMLWLAWDIGENMTSLLRLQRTDFTRMINPATGGPEYHVRLRREVLKRSRTPRTEITNYDETVALLDELLAADPCLEPVFSFGRPTAVKVLQRAVRVTGARCVPGGQPVTLKDLRSSMACDLLSKGWTTDEVNQRLGHKPSSREIDKYVNWLALNRHRPKRRMQEGTVAKLHEQIDQFRDREKLLQSRMLSMQRQVEQLQASLDANNRRMFQEVRRLVGDARSDGRLSSPVPHDAPAAHHAERQAPRHS